jgi:predicted DNA-binding ribbon-helix-helix protein
LIGRLLAFQISLAGSSLPGEQSYLTGPHPNRVIFATARTFSVKAIVCLKFIVPMLRSYNIGGVVMSSLIVKRSIVLGGHKTSVSVEDAFWESLKNIAARRHLTLSALLTAIDRERQHDNLSSAIRLYVLNCYRGQLDDGMGEGREAVEVRRNGDGLGNRSIPST